MARTRNPWVSPGASDASDLTRDPVRGSDAHPEGARRWSCRDQYLGIGALRRNLMAQNGYPFVGVL